MKSLLIIFLIFSMCHPAMALENVHIVIHEIHVSGGSGSSTDEFVELFNPTAADVSLVGWQLVKYTGSGSEYVLVDDFGTASIPAGRHFLVAHPSGYSGDDDPDVVYSTGNSIADNNTVALIDSADAVVDLVGYGSATVVESAAAINPGGNKSIERVGGDTDNNAADFLVRDVPTPHNSLHELPTENSQTEVYSSAISIVELFPDPVGTDDDEFIELYNAGSVSVDLAGWQLGDNSTRRYTIPNQVIGSGEYVAFAKSATGISLNNTGDAARLYWADGTEVSTVVYDSSHEGQSYALVQGVWQWTDTVTPDEANVYYIDNAPPTASFTMSAESAKVGVVVTFDGRDSSDPDNDVLSYRWDFGDGTGSTDERAEHSFQSSGMYQITLTVIDEHGVESEVGDQITIIDYDYSSALIISEVLPSCSPSDSQCEFIELYNGDSRDISLDGWQLTDQSRYFTFGPEDRIAAGGYLVIERPRSKITLNNSGDQLYLIDPAGNIIAGVDIPKATKDFSFAFSHGAWHWTEVVTPGEPNEIIEPVQEENDVEIAADIPDLGEIPIGAVTEDMIGSRLTVTGDVERANSRGIYLMDEAGNILRVYIQKATGIVQPDLEPGQTVTVSGVLDKTSAGLRLLPQVAEDIVIHADLTGAEHGVVLGASDEMQPESIAVESAPSSPMIYIIITAISVVVLAGGLLIRQRVMEHK